MKKVCLLVLVMFYSIVSVFGQVNSSISDGDWDHGATWTNGVPSKQWGSGILNISHIITVSNLINLGSFTVNIENGGSLTVNGNLLVMGGGTINIKTGGRLVVEGDFENSGNAVVVPTGATLFVKENAKFTNNLQINRGGTVIVSGDFDLAQDYKVIVAQTGTDNSDQYADFVVKKDFISSGGGDITINQNGRVAIGGNVTGASNGSTLFTVNQGGQVYLHGGITLTGSGDQITNTNSEDPFGLYVNGPVSNSGTGGGTATTGNVGSQEVMVESNPEFTEWVQGQLGLSLITPQPVNLLYFSATPQSQLIEINWASSKAWDFSHYELERSANGTTFEYVATIDAAEFSNENTEYSYSDRQPLFGTSYYRLKAVDVDGAFEYKEMAAVKFGAESFKVYPNPSAQGFITVSWSHAAEGTTASLKDNTGRTIRIIRLSGSADTISTEGLAAGVYFLSVHGPAGQKQAQVLIR